MEIREIYQREMNQIYHDKLLDQIVLSALDGTGKVRHRNTIQKRVVWAAAMVCAILLLFHFDTAITYAESIYEQFVLQLKGETIQLSDMIPIDIPIEEYLAREDVEKNEEGTSNWVELDNQKQLHEYTGLIIETSDKIELKDIWVNINKKYCLGRVSANVWYHDDRITSEPVTMNGMFIMEDFTGEAFGYGEERKAYDTYEYSEGKKAYFVREYGSDEQQTVYFVEEGILYQLFVENNESGKRLAEKIIDAMAE